MDADTKRELDLMWKHGVEETRKDIKDMRTELKKEIVAFKRLFVSLLGVAVPAWLGTVIAFMELKR